MLELHQLIMGLAPVLGTNVGIIEQIIKGMYCVSSGGSTMKNIARWTGKGASYRNIQRFFAQPIDWLQLNMLLLRSILSEPTDSNQYALAFDEVVEDKAGKQTYGLAWFYSSIAGKVIRSVSHHVVSLVDIKKESSFVLHSEQTVKPNEAPKKKRIAKQSKKSKGKSKALTSKGEKKQAGRPKGSKNKQNVKSTGLLYESFELLLTLVVPFILLYCPNLKYVLADGAYGNKTCCLIVRQFDLELISKLNRNTALFLPYQEVKEKKKKRGRPRKYGKKIDYKKIPEQYLVQQYEEDGIQTKIYQIKGVWTRTMPYLINVAIIVKTHLESQKISRVVLFSTDLNLEGEQLIKFYSLRFQIEFNFRDAKQYFGLADFKNIKQQQVKNAVGLAFFMDNISMILIEQAKTEWKEEIVSIQDLKAYFRGEKYLNCILNTLEIDQKDILNQTDVQQILKIGAINRTNSVKLAS
jgi:putative transposase